MDNIKCAEDIILDLERHGPAGLIHVNVLSNIIEKPIQIWNANGSLNRIIGKGRRGCSIDVEYHATDSEQIGHWTLKYGKDPDNIPIDLNSCLFSVIGSQIGRDPSELRQWTILNLKRNFRKLANWIDKILRLGKNGEIILMIGGARYSGTSPSDAKIILDSSQDQRSHGHPPLGHPRGHAECPSGFSIVEYSQYSDKTGFQSRADQDYVTHLALSTRIAQDAMTELNRGKTTIAVRIPSDVLRNSRNLPPVVRYQNGVLTARGNMIAIVLVLRHHVDQFNNPDADVFVHTCYPIMA